MKDKFSAEFYKAILDHIHSNIYITDAETDEIIYMNDFMKKTYHVPEPEGKICWKVLQQGKSSRCEFCKVNELLLKTDNKAIFWREDSPVTGRTYMNFDVIQEHDGRKYHIQNSMDITDQVKLSLEASTDELTGLLNRQAGRKRLEDLLNIIKGDESFVVALYDIDGLKWVNDTYGHLEGDRLLRYIATSMRQSLDEPDFIFRLSGDEFIVVLVNRELHEAESWMKRMLECLEQNKGNIGIHYDVSFSYGLARIRGTEKLTVSDILSLADTQMYMQKRDHHIRRAQKRRQEEVQTEFERRKFKYSQEHLFDAISESVDEYTFVGNLKTGHFMYSYKMMLDFGLPGQVLSDAAAFWGERIHPEDRLIFLRSNQEIADGKAEQHTITYRAKNAENKWVHLLCKGKMVRDEDGNPDLFAGIIRNLDRQEQRGFNLEKHSPFYFVNETSEGVKTNIEESLLYFVNRNIPGGITAVYDEPDYPILCFSQTLLEYTGCTYDELIQKTEGKYVNLIYEADRPMVADEMRKQLEEKDTYDITYRILCGDNELMWVHEVGKYAVNKDGQKFILSFFIDVSRDVESETQLRFINENSVDGVFRASITEGFPVLYANEVYYRLHGYTRKQMKEELNDLAAPLIYEEDLERLNREVEAVLARNAEQTSFEYRIKKRDGSLAWVHVDAGFRTMANGSITMVGMVMDITERRRMEDQLFHTENLYNLVLAHTRLNVWEFDLENRIIRMANVRNQKYHDVFYHVPYGLIERGNVCENSVQSFIDLHEKMIQGARKESATIQIKKRAGGFKWEKVTYIALEEETDSRWAIGISEDVTAQKEAEIRAYHQEKMSEILARDSLYSLRINLTKGIVEDTWNEEGEQPQVPLEQIQYTEIWDRIYQQIASEKDRKRFLEQFSPESWEAYGEEGNITKEFEYQQIQKDGRIIWVSLGMKLIVAPVSGEKILILHGRNIDAVKKRELALQKKAEIDETSGLYNQSTAKLLTENILRDRIQGAGNHALFLLDVDDFKEVNRIGGFLAGETVLKSMGSLIREQQRTNCIAGRLTGDVFILFCYQMESKRVIQETAQRLGEALSRVYAVAGKEFELTVSIGVADACSIDSTYELLYQRAQYALDVAKRKEKNKIVFYDEVENREILREIQMRIDAHNHEVLYMNESGRAAFGYDTTEKVEKKCYELLHDRKTPCPFCEEKYKGADSEEWECFVQSLNRLLYVREHEETTSGGNTRFITLNTHSSAGERSDDDKEIYSLVEQAWSGAEKGESENAAYRLFLEYIGKYCNAKAVTLYACEEATGQLVRSADWNGYKETKIYRIDNSRLHLLEEVLLAGAPGNSILISGPNSPGYTALREAYQAEQFDYPVVVSGFFRDSSLQYCILVEDPDPKIKLLKVMEKIVERVRRLHYLYQIQKSYAFAVSHDPKTELLNYESYMERIGMMKQDSLTTLGMIGIRMVNLRAYNEKYGEARGDEILAFMAELIRQQFGERHCYRMGRTTFFVLCEDISYGKFLEKYEALHERMNKEYSGLTVMANVWEQNAIFVNRMKAQVEEKLTVALNLRKSLDGTGSLQTASRVLKDLKESIATRRFCTYLQPKADARTGEICGAEALVRYLDPELGILPPGRFLAPIENAGLIRYVDLFVLEDVCRMIRKWIGQGWKPFPISLNYSRVTILEPNILEETNRIVERYQIPKNLIEFEVTETIGSIDSASLRNIVDNFVAAGYKIALDDYGADYSNVYILYSLRIHTLKLDRTIVNDVYHNRKARLIVENIIDICKKFEITCVAEGVEDKEYLEVLRNLSCDLIQGYYINKPMPEEDFAVQYIQ